MSSSWDDAVCNAAHDSIACPSICYDLVANRRGQRVGRIRWKLLSTLGNEIRKPVRREIRQIRASCRGRRAGHTDVVDAKSKALTSGHTGEKGGITRSRCKSLLRRGDLRLHLQPPRAASAVRWSIDNWYGGDAEVERNMEQNARI